jgi:hypothetical protein
MEALLDTRVEGLEWSAVPVNVDGRRICVKLPNRRERVDWRPE